MGAEIPSIRQQLYSMIQGRPVLDESWFSYLTEINPTKAGNVLPVANGGTGVTASTGTGFTVRNVQPNLLIPTLNNPKFRGAATWLVSSSPQETQLFGSDANLVSVTAVATTLISFDVPCLFIVHDKTSGGVTIGTMDQVGGVTIISAGIAGIAFTRLAGTGLRAAVTAGANPRSLSTFSIATGVQ